MKKIIGNELFVTKLIEYQAATNKGDVKKGDLINNPFKLAKADSAYTGEAVTEAITSTAAAMALAWTPVVKKAFDSDGAGTMKDVKIVAADGTVTYADLDSDGKVPAAALVANGKVAYRYDNVVVPQNDIPRIKAEMKNIPLIAKARRIAIYYSQLAAFQAKTDYGYELGDSLAEQATSRLQYKHFVPLAA